METLIRTISILIRLPSINSAVEPFPKLKLFPRGRLFHFTSSQAAAAAKFISHGVLVVVVVVDVAQIGVSRNWQQWKRVWETDKERERESKSASELGKGVCGEEQDREREREREKRETLKWQLHRKQSAAAQELLATFFSLRLSIYLHYTLTFAQLVSTFPFLPPYYMFQLTCSLLFHT